MKGIKRAALLTAFLGMVLCVCGGLLAGCKALFNPEYTVTFNADGGKSGAMQTRTVGSSASIWQENNMLKSELMKKLLTAPWYSPIINLSKRFDKLCGLQPCRICHI